VPRDGARLGEIRLDDWIRMSAATPAAVWPRFRGGLPAGRSEPARSDPAFQASTTLVAMDEQATFEPKAVLAPRRAGWNRLTIVVPALALAALAWAGANGGQSPQQVATATDAVAAVGPSPTLDTRGAPQYPTQTLGLKVKRLNEIDPLGLRRDEVVAI
jgi:hypothetical protein